jgi:hypothetical protein
MGGVKEGSPAMVISVVILAVLSLLAGIFINYPAGVVEVIVKQMMGGGA